MEETVIGFEGPSYEDGVLTSCRAGDACGCQTVPESEGITAIEANENAQPAAAEEPATENVEIEVCLDQEPCGEGEPCGGEKWDDDCPRDDGAAFTVIGSEELKPKALKTIAKKEQESLRIEFVLPDEGNTLNYRGKKIFNQHKSDVRQMVAKEELHFKYYDGSEDKDVVIPAGTRGGYVWKDARVKNAWIDDRSIIYGPAIEDSYIVDSSIHSYGCIEDSYLSGCKCEHYIDLDVRKSTLFSVDFNGDECSVDKSYLINGEIKSSRVERCRNLRGFEIFNSIVENVYDVTRFVVNGAGIKDADKDFLQVTNVGGARRTVCAYRTPRGGVMVSTGCFRGTLDELAIANAQSHLGYNMSEGGYLVKNRPNVSRKDEWCYKEYDMLIKYIKHHFKLDVNTMTIPTKY